MNTVVSPQPQRWDGYWLWLNTLYTTNELCHRFDWQWHDDHRDGAWCWRINATPKPVRKKARE